MATVTAPVTKGFRKASEAMRGDTLRNIQQLRGRFAQIERERAEHSRRCTGDVEEKKARFDETRTFADEVAYILAKVVEEWHLEHSTSPVEKARLIYGINAV